MNKPSDKAAVPILAENGVVITKTHLSAGGQAFAFAKIQFVRVEKAAQHPLAAFLKRPTCG
jgi:hypothetical protein